MARTNRLGRAAIASSSMAAAVLLGSLAVVLPADATSSTKDDFQVVSPRVDGRVIDGIVTADGKPVDDAKVFAIDEDGDIAASALTYASQRASGPQHGYFFLDVPDGVYTVVAKFKGFKASKVDDVVVEDDKLINVGTIALEPTAVPTSVDVDCPDSVPVGRDVIMTVKVKSKKAPVGKVLVKRDGKVVASKPVSAAKKGVLKLNVGDYKPGTQTFYVVFEGTKSFKDSKAKVVKVKVTKVRGRG